MPVTSSEPTVGATLFMPGWPTRHRAYHGTVRKVESIAGVWSDPNDPHYVIITVRWEIGRTGRWKWVAGLLGWSGMFDSRHFLEQLQREKGRFVWPIDLPNLYSSADAEYERIVARQ